MKQSYYVYAIELNSAVIKNKKFSKKNPKYISGRPCVYIGQSAWEPAIRFAQHKNGYKSNRFAKKYGKQLLPGIFENYNPITTRANAIKQEKLLAIKLRKFKVDFY